MFMVENPAELSAVEFSPRVVSLTMGLFSFSLLPIRDMAPRDELRWCSVLLDRMARSMCFERAFKGPRVGEKERLLTN